MDSKLLEEVKKAQRLYFLSLKFEDRLPKNILEFSKGICNEYTRRAKETELKLDDSDWVDYILK